MALSWGLIPLTPLNYFILTISYFIIRENFNFIILYRGRRYSGHVLIFRSPKNFLMLNRPLIDNQKKKFKKIQYWGFAPPKTPKIVFKDFSAAFIVILLVFGIVASNYILLRYMIQPMNNF